MMKKILLILIILFPTIHTFGQNNSGSPYSRYGIGLLPDNFGIYTAMGGVSAAMRDAYNINYLNPASYTALDSMRFYFQVGMNGEYVYVSTTKAHTDYTAGQNGSLNMAFRIIPKLYASIGFNERTDIGYDLSYTEPIIGDATQYYNKRLEGEGGLNDAYLGLAYQFGKLSVGVNAVLLFGKLEERETIYRIAFVDGMFDQSGYYIRTRTRNQIHDFIFTLGAQYPFKIKNNTLMLGAAGNFGTYVGGYNKFEAYKYSMSSSAAAQINNDVLDDGKVFYPSRVTFGGAYEFKNKRWLVSGDYTFQNMSQYKEFGDKTEDFEGYHKVAVGGYFQPDETGRYWWQRNKYMAGGYFTRSHLFLKEHYINSFGITLGIQMPLQIASQALLLGFSVDGGIRGTEANTLIKEQYIKVRINIAFKELWFAKRKIN